jgi:archaellum biogenesis ATPase FlaH
MKKAPGAAWGDARGGEIMDIGPLIPVKLGAKFPPLLREWQNASQADLAQAWGRFEGANIALRLDHLLALDPDDQAAQDFLDTLEKEGQLPPTITWSTWRNRTIRLYRGRNGLSPVKPPKGSPMMLEVRTGSKQYCILPPSQVNGRLYQFLPHLSPQDLEPAELPQEALKRILKALQRPEATQESRQTPRSPWANLWQGVPEGSRDDTAAKLAGRLLSRGLPPDEVIEILVAWDARNNPPLGDRDLARVVHSIGRKEDRKEAGMKFITGDDLLEIKLNAPKSILSGGILPAGGSLIITGDSGAGKSLLALEMALCLTHGLNLWDMKVPKPFRVIIFQAENPTHSLQYRLRRIMEGHGLEQSRDLIITDPRLKIDLRNDLDRRKLADMIERAKAEVAILDPLSSYHHVNENDNIAMRGVLDGLTAISRATGVAWMVLHHHGKPSKDKKNTKWEFRGATSIRDWADTMVALLPKPQKGSNKIVRLLRFDKVRHGPERSDLLLERDQLFCHLVSEEEIKAPPSAVVEVLQELGGRRRLNELAQAIGERTGACSRTAYRAIDRACGRGISKVEVEGTWWVFFT